MGTMKTLVRFVIVVSVLVAAAGADAKKKPVFRDDVNPVIFVHGGSGSGAQFESQAMRFASNGYDPRYLSVVEYNSAGVDAGSSADQAFIFGLIDDRIAELQAATGRAQVDLMGHSFGTTWSHLYLAEPSRAAKVAHYVNIDGRPAAAPPGGVPTLALWAGAVDRPVQGEIVGALNVTIPNQEHVEVATSAESFVEMFRFLAGEDPATSDIVREPGKITLAGRAVTFPDNVGADGATLEMWTINPRTGRRRNRKPSASVVLGSDGAFSFTGFQKNHYEFVLTGVGALPLHYFFERYPRSDHLIRVNAAPLLDPFLPTSPDRTGMAVIRYKEFWGDRGAENDVLSIDGIDVINPVTAPSGAVGTASVAFFVLDVGQDGITDLETVPFPFTTLAFLTGADLYLSALPPTPLRIVTVPRGDTAATRTVTIRRIPSTQGRVVVFLHDFEQ
jgi:pimeloyl-ACP methyl ester carboxylesterase